MLLVVIIYNVIDILKVKPTYHPFFACSWLVTVRQTNIVCQHEVRRLASPNGSVSG